MTSPHEYSVTNQRTDGQSFSGSLMFLISLKEFLEVDMSNRTTLTQCSGPYKLRFGDFLKFEFLRHPFIPLAAQMVTLHETTICGITLPLTGVLRFSPINSNMTLVNGAKSFPLISSTFGLTNVYRNNKLNPLQGGPLTEGSAKNYIAPS